MISSVTGPNSLFFDQPVYLIVAKNNKKISRRERERLARRREILKAARKVFGARGYEGATLDEVARTAEFAKGTLYSYFDSKAKLFAELIEYEFEDVMAQAKKALRTEDDVEDATRAAIRVFLEFFEERTDFFRAVMAYREEKEAHGAEEVKAAIMKRIGELGALLGAKLAAGVRGGVIKEYDAGFLGFLLLGFVHYYSFYTLRYGGSRKLTDGADMLCDIYLDGVRSLRPSVPEE
jgi:AcrR family transcriptional regulator